MRKVPRKQDPFQGGMQGGTLDSFTSGWGRQCGADMQIVQPDDHPNLEVCDRLRVWIPLHFEKVVEGDSVNSVQSCLSPTIGSGVIVLFCWTWNIGDSQPPRVLDALWKEYFCNDLDRTKAESQRTRKVNGGHETRNPRDIAKAVPVIGIVSKVEPQIFIVYLGGQIDVG